MCFLDNFPLQCVDVLNVGVRGVPINQLLVPCSTKQPRALDVRVVLEHGVPPESPCSLTHLQSVHQSRTWPFSIFGSGVYMHTLSTHWIGSQ